MPDPYTPNPATPHATISLINGATDPPTVGAINTPLEEVADNEANLRALFEGSSVVIQEATVAGLGNWTKPDDCVMHLFIAVGGGGGGGAENGSTGGGGGGSGGIVTRWLPDAAVGSTVPFDVGAGGAGGGIGEDGEGGEVTTIGSFSGGTRAYLRAFGGGGGHSVGGTGDPNGGAGYCGGGTGGTVGNDGAPGGDATQYNVDGSGNGVGGGAGAGSGLSVYLLPPINVPNTGTAGNGGTGDGGGGGGGGAAGHLIADILAGNGNGTAGATRGQGGLAGRGYGAGGGGGGGFSGGGESNVSGSGASGYAAMISIRRKDSV